ncbi:hypothetical protein F5B21DRAFT_320054 [Xylaria acuta]|nr:hypothetical protein F5B21DRAFT_320054 [Xylaria acuta]
MVAKDPKTPLERLEDLTGRVHNLEAAFQVQFAQWSKKKLGSAAEYFLWAYTETIHAMELIRAENYKSDYDTNLRPELDILFQRVVKLLHQAVEYVKVAKYQLTPVHKGLLKNVHRINNTPDIGNDGLNMHQIKMGNQLMEIRPPNRAAWMKDGKDLKPNSEFDRIYEDFCQLKRDTRIAQTSHEMYATGSWQLLQSAFQALHLPVIEILPDDDFFDNDVRWTFVDYPYGSDEFLYGINGRPGMLALKNKIGGILTNSEREKMSGPVHGIAKVAKVIVDEDYSKQKNKGKGKEMSNAGGKPAMKEKHKEKNGEPSKSKDKTIKEKRKKKDKKEKKKSKKNKKSPTNEAGPNPKKPRTGWGGYTMNIVNAAADVEDCLRDSMFTSVRDDDVYRPGPERLLTPTVETRRTTLVAYHEDLRYITDEIYKRRFGTPMSRDKLPQTATDRKAWLALAKKELLYARAGVHNLIDSANSPAKAKKLRLAAYKLKLVRAMYTIGLVSGEPAASAERIKEGLMGRLDDWILHEQAWNAAEEVIMGRPGITQETYEIINGQVEERDANITRWKQLRAEVEKGGYEAEPVADLSIFIENNKLAEEEVEEEEVKQEQEEEEEEEEQGVYEYGEKGIEEHEDTADDESEVANDHDLHDEGSEDTEIADYYKVQENDEEIADYYKVQQGGEEVADYYKVQDEAEEEQFDRVLTHKEIANGRILLWNVLRPKRPDAGDYLLDWREERRRRRWYEQAARARLTNKPLPPWNHLPVTDVFARGGPPSYENLPRKTTWERLQYVLVLTYWRFYQLRLMEP